MLFRPLWLTKWLREGGNLLCDATEIMNRMNRFNPLSDDFIIEHALKDKRNGRNCFNMSKFSDPTVRCDQFAEVNVPIAQEIFDMLDFG